jgi:hypothetical protein
MDPKNIFLTLKLKKGAGKAAVCKTESTSSLFYAPGLFLANKVCNLGLFFFPIRREI